MWKFKLISYLKYNKKIYLLIIIQFIIVSTMWMVAQNTILTGEETLSQIEDEFPINRFRIKKVVTDGADAHIDNITRDDYKRIKNSVPKSLELNYCALYSINNYDKRYDEFKYTSMVFMDDEMLKRTLGFKNTAESIIDKRSKDKILDFWKGVDDVVITENSIGIEGTLFKLKEAIIPDDIILRRDFSKDEDGILSDNIRLANTIIASESLIDKMKNLKFKDLTEMKLQYSLVDVYLSENTDWISELQSLLSHLNSEEEKTIYITEHLRSSIKKEISDDTELLRQLQSYSIGLLLIVVPGTIGLYSIFVKKRERDYAISLMVGAKKEEVIKELTIEVFLLLSISLTLSTMFALILNRFGNTRLYDNYFHIKTLIYALAMSGVIGILILVKPIYKLSNITVSDLFREGERI